MHGTRLAQQIELFCDIHRHIWVPMTVSMATGVHGMAQKSQKAEYFFFTETLDTGTKGTGEICRDSGRGFHGDRGKNA